MNCYHWNIETENSVVRHINPTVNRQSEMLSFSAELQNESDNRYRSQQFDANYLERNPLRLFPSGCWLI